MPFARRSMFTQMTISGGVTLEGAQIATKSMKEIESTLDRELRELKKELLKEVKRMKGQ